MNRTVIYVLIGIIVIFLLWIVLANNFAPLPAQQEVMTVSPTASPTMVPSATSVPSVTVTPTVSVSPTVSPTGTPIPTGQTTPIPTQ